MSYIIDGRKDPNNIVDLINKALKFRKDVTHLMFTTGEGCFVKNIKYGKVTEFTGKIFEEYHEGMNPIKNIVVITKSEEYRDSYKILEYEINEDGKIDFEMGFTPDFVIDGGGDVDVDAYYDGSEMNYHLLESDYDLDNVYLDR